MPNKRTMIGVVSAGALLIGVGIARSVVTTERIVTDEAFNLAQQTGQPVWETYQRHIWLAWIGSVIAVAGVSGVAASLYARDEEIDDIADRVLTVRDRVATTVPALRAISRERHRSLPPQTSEESADEQQNSSEEAATNRLKKSSVVTPISAPIKTPIPTPIALQPNTTPPLNLTRTSDPLHAAPQVPAQTSSSPDDLSLLEEEEPEALEKQEDCVNNPPTLSEEWLDPLDLRDNVTSRSREIDKPIAQPADPFSDLSDLSDLNEDENEFEPLFLSEPSLEDWGISSVRAMSLADEASEDLVLDRNETEPIETFKTQLDQKPDNAHLTPDPASANLLAALVTTSLVCVCGDNSQETIATAKANLLRELIDQRLDRGHKCIVCDPYDEVQTWRGCDRLGQNEDYAMIDVAIATIVAELETRLEAITTGQADFSPITLVCFHPSDWIDRCASAPLLAARTIDSAKVAISLILIETAPPKQWGAFGHNALSFPDNAFLELELDLSETELTNLELRAEIQTPTAPDPDPIDRAQTPQAQNHPPETTGDPSGHPVAIAWVRDPSRLDANALETIALPEFNTPLFSAPPIRSRPPLTVPPGHPITETEQNLVGNLSPNQAENSYPMADSETEKQLRSQITLFQDLGMTREQIIVAVWDVRTPDSDEYEIASAFYDRLTR
jgi:hypothetical protein